ncbi:MAG: ABC transporter permease [Candidatus Auribacterota bacterium]
MRTIFVITLKELRSYFFSLTGYVIWSLFLLIEGFVFWFLLNAFSNPQNSFNEPISHFFFGTFYYWFLLLIIPPLLTMRSLAEEYKSGTIDLLSSAPITEAQIIMAKFFAAFIFFSFMWCSTLFYFYLIEPHTELDWMRIINGYLGTFLVSGLFISVGIFASSISTSQIVSAIIAFAFALLLFSFGFIEYFISSPIFSGVLKYCNIMDSTIRFGQGIFDTRPVIFFLSLTVLFLNMSVAVLDSRRWR